ncbi:alpha-N-acetylgalactosaminidase isoform X3 [Chelonia mydas]|uniref:alpha-N-acetylgalactosaminidase isoform X3 n=1 Tax=Chelonia mydas TaxID=8469 RepID=UPI001CA9E23A|nr:alpha-N-acetylgalactosaminidase isoform X3 [Chelonia mydas]
MVSSECGRAPMTPQCGGSHVSSFPNEDLPRNRSVSLPAFGIVVLLIMLLPPLSILLGLAACCSSLDNGLLRTPPMGWLPWERFRCNTDCKTDPGNCISENLIKSMADKMAEDGWKELGYKYVNLDDCWSAKERDSQGRLQPDPDRFPSGIKALADYVHSKGLKFGIYSDMGNYTCNGYPGTTLDTIDTDAKTFAEWEVDMLKLDGCYSNSSVKAIGYPKMSIALNKTGRPIAYSCSWPAYEGGLPPKLIIGNFGLSYEQSKVQMALWAILAAPLFMSSDLRTISEDAKYILQNKLLIYINQDSLGIQGQRIIQSHHFEVWKRILFNGQFAVAVMNNGTDGMPRPFTTNFALLGILDCKEGYKIYNVLEQMFLGDFALDTTINIEVTPTGVVLLFLRPLCSVTYFTKPILRTQAPELQ